MIKIIEATPKKISGSTSLFLELPFNQTSIDIIKASGLAVWHKKDKVWECPLTSLSYLLDNLTYVDDINLSLQKDIHSNQLIIYSSMSPWLQEFIHKYNNT